MRHFLMIMKRCEIVHTIFEYFALYVALKSYYLAWYSINNQIHQKCLIWILIVCSKLLQQTFEFLRQKWQHHKCDSKYRFAHPLPLICDMSQENVLKTLPCTQLQSSALLKWDTLYNMMQIVNKIFIIIQNFQNYPELIKTKLYA